MLYPDGDFFINYDIGGQFIVGDMIFRVEFIGPTTMDYTAATTETVDVFAVDNQGNVSAACTPTFTLNDLCTFSRFNNVVFGDGSAYCPDTPEAFSIQADLSPGAGIDWCLGTNDNRGALIATGSDVNITGPPSVTTVTVTVAIDSPDGCPAGEFQEFTVPPETTPPTVATINITRMLDANNMLTVSPEEVFDAAGSSDNCDLANRTVTYSRVEAVTFTGQPDALTVRPNPATDEATASAPENTVRVELLDVTGRRMEVRFSRNGQSWTTDVSGLPAGLFQLNAVSDKRVVSTSRLIVR